MAEQYANSVVTTLNGAIAAGDLSLVVASATGMPATGDFRLKIDSELLICTARTGTTLTVTRAAESTTAAAHSSGSTVSLVLTAAQISALAVGPASSTDHAVARFDGATGKLLQNTSALTVADDGTIGFPDGIRQTFNPNGTNAGVNVGSHAGVPSSLSDGDVFYDSSANALKARVNGTTVNLSAGTSSSTRVVGLVIDGGGSAISTGVKGYTRVPFAGTISKVTMLADQSGSIVVDVWKDTYANYPPTDADSITASAPPTISAATKSEDATLTGWTTSVSAGDVFGFNVDSASTVTRVSVLIEVTV
jgi:hypothetical protein